MPEFFGLCGRATPVPCRLAWASTYPNKVGIYPNEFLPTTRTVYHAASDGGYKFTAPLVPVGETFGLPFGGFIFGFFGPPQFDVFTPQSHIVTIFARTANRFNVPHVVTQAEFLAAQANDGKVTIDVGEYIFEFLSVTDQKEAYSVSEEDLEDIEGTDEAASDRAFRNLFSQIPPSSRNRFESVEVNKVGVQYRFDNGSNKVNSALKLAGLGDLKNPSYRDGSSRKINVDFNKITDRIPTQPGESPPPAGSLQGTTRAVRAGDIIYLSYIAVKEHYIRQNVEASYTIQAISVPPEAYGFPSKCLVANYRFYEWNVDSSESPGSKVKVGGWRVVETFNIPTNVVAAIGPPLQPPELGQFIITNGTGVTSVNVLNTKDINIEYLETYIEDLQNFGETAVFGPDGLDRAVTYTVNLNQSVSGGKNYHQQLDESFKLAPWYLRRNYTNFQGYADMISHVFYNVHPSALLKRDVDKFGIERSLAQEIELDIKQGKDTFFPFMDDPAVINPTQGVSIFLDSTNTKFEPIQPISRYNIANLEIEAGVAGAVLLGNTGSNDDVVAVFSFNSNVISERFEEDTRVLSERHFTFGQKGPRTIAIEGQAGRISGLTCIADPGDAFSFVAHANSNSFLTINKFTMRGVFDGLSQLTYRPDLEAPPQKDNNDPQPSQFVKQLGYSGLLGDKPGITPGVIASYSNYASLDSFTYKTNNRAKLLTRLPDLDPDQITETTPVYSSDRIVIDVGSGYSGKTELEYTCNNANGVEAFIQFKSGGNVSGVIDSVYFSPTSTPLSIKISHYWMQAQTIEIVGENIDSVNIVTTNVQQLETLKSTDFLDDTSSSSLEDKPGFLANVLPDRSLFFETDIMSLGEDEKSRLYLFFNDNDGGISCIQSGDFGMKWHYHYGVVEAINQEESRNPFVLNVAEHRGCFLFFQFSGKIFCRFIPFELFLFEDAMLIQRFETDILQEDEDGNRSENSQLFSQSGINLRRRLIGYAAAGDMGDAAFRQFVGRNPDNSNALEDTEVREVTDSNGNTVSIPVRKNPLAISSGSAFTRVDIEDIHFSAYRTDTGILKLFFLTPAREDIGGGNQLQCHFSSDGGKSWYDYWEWIEYGYNRLRTDATEKTQFIDRESNGAPSGTLLGEDPLLEELSYFGINLHWSRLSKHKQGDPAVDAESQVLDFQSPYVFYQSGVRKVFLFYVYESCLLCKIFNEGIFSEAAKLKRANNGSGGMNQVKRIIERNNRSYFVDGNLSGSGIREEIHRYYNEESNEVMADGNIILHAQWGIDAFNQSRTISPQRVCAYELPQGGVRVFYKHNGSENISAALWTGSSWIVEDLMKDAGLEGPLLAPPVNAEAVCGGFSGSGFPCS